MNKKEFEKELDKKLASVKEEMMQKFEEEQEDEFPKYGDRYYYLTTSGDIESIIWTDDEFDRYVSAIGNRYKTEKETEFECERRKVITELKKFAEPKDREWNGENNHWVYRYDFTTKEVDCDWLKLLKYDGIYFESLDKAEDALEKVGEDRVKKYYLGVK